MATLWRNTPSGLPFFWEQDNIFPARWHAAGDGPAQYLADTPAGAWAELVRHEEIVDPADVAGLARDLWAVEVPDADLAGATAVSASEDVLLGGPDTYPACQALATEARAQGATALVAPSAALVEGAAGGLAGGRWARACARGGRARRGALRPASALGGPAGRGRWAPAARAGGRRAPALRAGPPAAPPQAAGGGRGRSYGRRLNQSSEPPAARAKKAMAAPLNQSPTSRFTGVLVVTDRPSCSYTCLSCSALAAGE